MIKIALEILAGIAIVAAVAMFLAGCSSERQDSSPTPPPGTAYRLPYGVYH